MSKTCPDCLEVKQQEDFYRNKAKRDGLQTICKVCSKNRNSSWYRENKEFHNEYMRNHSYQNRHLYNARDSKRRASELMATPSWADLCQIKAIYEVCKRVSDKTGVAHHVDHVIPLQGKNVCGLHVEKNLAIIPAKMNLSKGNTFENET